jgi:hypothetical protein
VEEYRSYVSVGPIEYFSLKGLVFYFQLNIRNFISTRIFAEGSQIALNGCYATFRPTIGHGGLRVPAAVSGRFAKHQSVTTTCPITCLGRQAELTKHYPTPNKSRNVPRNGYFSKS